MVDQHPPLRASGPARMLGLLVVLVGIAAMHAGVFTVGHGAQHRAPEHHGIVAMVSDAHPSSVTGEHALGHVDRRP